ncbi:hypothetical protein [Microbacterium sp. CH-015]|uniref:hypothetical protein n=1 Tax=Microbacterium sp. CH-015 TaxID=3406734 RepID=UPI003C74D4A8
MSNHTRVDIEATDDYECAFGDCGHEVRPCPTSTWDCCRECTDRSWGQYEGGVVTWDECKGVGASFAEQELDDACLDEFDLPTRSADPVHPPMPVGHIRACGCPECVAWLEAHEPADPVRCPKCGGPDPFHDPACVVHPDLIQDHENGSK